MIAASLKAQPHIRSKAGSRQKKIHSSIFYYQSSPLTFGFKNNSKIFGKKILYKAEFYYRRSQNAGNISHINKAIFEVTKNNHFSEAFLNELVKKFEADLGLKK